MDIQKEREAFENHLKKMGKTDNETFSKNEDDSYQMDIIHFGWKIWQAAIARMEVRINTLDEILLNQGEALAQAKAQAVQQSFEIGRLQDRITELLDERQDLYAQINNDQAVPDTQQKLTDTYYLEGSDYVVDCPFEYDIEIDKGEVLELQKWQRTDSTKVYFANIYKDEDNFEILQFASKAEAENAVAENLKMLEASESGAEE